MSEQKSALLVLLGVAMLWGFSYVVSAFLLHSFSPILLSFSKMCLTWLFMLSVLVKTGKQRWPTRKEWLIILLSSIFGTLIQQPLYFIGLQYSTAANASLIYAVAPLAAIILERIFLKVRLTGIKLLGGFLGFLGVLVIVSSGGASFRISMGDLLLLAAMLGMTISMLFTPLLAKSMSSVSIYFYSGPVGVLLMAPLAGGEALTGQIKASGDTLVIVLLIVLGMTTALSGVWWTQGVAVAGPGKAAMFMNIPPFISLIAGHFILGEPIYTAQLLGGVLVLAGVYITNSRRRGQGVPPVSEES